MLPRSGDDLVEQTDLDTAVTLVTEGEATALPEEDAVLVDWARLLAADPNEATQAHVDRLRGARFDDGRIVAPTVYVALRLAFSTVNDALGARPDAELAAAAPPQLLSAITSAGGPRPPPESRLRDVPNVAVGR